MGCFHSCCMRKATRENESKRNFVPEEDRPSNDGSSSSGSGTFLLNQGSGLSGTAAKGITFDKSTDPQAGEEERVSKRSKDSKRSIKTLFSSRDSRRKSRQEDDLLETTPCLQKESLRSIKELKELELKTNLADKPSQEEVLSWADSSNGFENLMSSSIGRNVFGNFLKKEFSYENLKFWEECVELKTIQNNETLKLKVAEIFQTYLDTASSQEVHIITVYLLCCIQCYILCSRSVLILKLKTPHLKKRTIHQKIFLMKLKLKFTA